MIRQILHFMMAGKWLALLLLPLIMLFAEKIIRIVCLVVGVCFVSLVSARGQVPAPWNKLVGEQCVADLVAFELEGYHADARWHRRALNQIGILRIAPSSDPIMLFEEFAKRLSVVAVVSKDDWPPRDIRSIVKTGGGNEDELAFVLLTLFTANDIEGELVHIYTGSHPVTRDIDRVLVYLPVLDQVFDPTLPAAEQHKGSGWAVLDQKPRRHRGYPVWRSAYSCPGSRTREFYGKGSPKAGQ